MNVPYWFLTLFTHSSAHSNSLRRFGLNQKTRERYFLPTLRVCHSEILPPLASGWGSILDRCDVSLVRDDRLTENPLEVRQIKGLVRADRGCRRGHEIAVSPLGGDGLVHEAGRLGFPNFFCG